MTRKVSLQYFEGCPNWRTTAGHLARLADEGLDVTVDHECIDSHESAVARGFHGSPTVLVDGADPFADENMPVGLACRVYRTPHGIDGSPTLSQLRQALTSKPEIWSSYPGAHAVAGDISSSSDFHTAPEGDVALDTAGGL